MLIDEGNEFIINVSVNDPDDKGYGHKKLIVPIDEVEKVQELVVPVRGSTIVATAKEKKKSENDIAFEWNFFINLLFVWLINQNSIAKYNWNVEFNKKIVSFLKIQWVLYLVGIFRLIWTTQFWMMIPDQINHPINWKLNIS